MIKVFASIATMFVILCTLWCTAASAAECERRALANDRPGQYVVTCEGTLPMVRTFPTRRTMVRRVVGSTTVDTRTVRIGVTHVVARLGTRA